MNTMLDIKIQKRFGVVTKLTAQSKEMTCYRKALFQAFYHSPYSQFCRDNYVCDLQKEEMHHGVSYYETDHFFYWNHCIPVAGMAMNYNNRMPFQCEKVGFSLNEEEKKNSCESLHFFNFGSSRDFMTSLFSFKERTFSICRKKNIHLIYGTTPQKKLLRAYKMIGWQEKDYLQLSENSESWLMVMPVT